jgi:hypothetical protein
VGDERVGERPAASTSSWAEDELGSWSWYTTVRRTDAEDGTAGDEMGDDDGPGEDGLCCGAWTISWTIEYLPGSDVQIYAVSLKRVGDQKRK